MTKETFASKTYPPKILGALLVLFSIFFPFTSKMGWGTYPFVLLCLAAAFFCWKLPTWRIEINDTGIKKTRYGSYGVKLFDRLLAEPDVELDWNQIRSITTERISYRYSDFFLTVISSSENTRNNIRIASNHFNDYMSILKIIQVRARHARFDPMTESIARNEVDFRAIRPFYRWLAIFFILFLVLYRYFYKS